LWQSDKHLPAMVPVFLGRNWFSRSFVWPHVGWGTL
jgi:hypothetical protein